MGGKLYLIPSTIGDTDTQRVIPEYIKEVISSIRFYIVENERTARRMLIKLGIKAPIDELKFYLLNQHTSDKEIPDFLSQIENADIGILSEAGVPAVADPGSKVVKIAHSRGIQVVPLVGPSSILLALMASGLNGQNFSFLGYLPIKRPERAQKLKQIENLSKTGHQAQIFIEAPYRNNQLLEDILEFCNTNTHLCIAADITCDEEFIKTNTLFSWQKNKPDLHKRPTIFILQA